MPLQGVFLCFEGFHALHWNGQVLDESASTFHLLSLRAVLFLIAELEAFWQTINGEASRLHVLDLEGDVVVLVGIDHFVKPCRKLWITKFGNAVPQLVCLPAIGIALQRCIQQVFPFLICLVGQTCLQHIDLGTSIQVGILVAKPRQ